MFAVFTGKRDLNTRDAQMEITFVGLYKKNKEAVKSVEKYQKEIGANWNPNIKNMGNYEIHGTEYAYFIVPATDNVPININLSESFGKR